MVILLLTSGISLSKLCSLPFDCLVRHPQEVWFLGFDKSKTPIEYTIPLSPIALATILDQQLALEQDHHGETNLLFLNAKGQGISPKTFMTQLNRLAVDKNICDASGKVWRFQSHQFPYTLAAQMIKDDVPFWALRRQLGHRADNVMHRYFHL
jgi:integrase